MYSRSVLLSLAAAVPLVAAHGHFAGAFIDDVYIPGPDPNTGNSGQFAIREINNIEPVKGADNPDLFCGRGAQPAALVADARQGSEIKFTWLNGEFGPWVHNTGPVMTYMTSCGDAGCANFDDRSAEWFKISELGRHDDGSSWYMADLTTGINATLSATIPTFLPDGEYLVRHELLALHNGMSEGGAEWYPGCLQVRLTGGVTSQTATSLPSGNDVATLPGAYKDDDPGVLVPDVYNPGSSYTFPGPPVVTAADTDPSTDPSVDPSSSDSPANTSSSTSSSDSATPTPTSGCGYSGKKKKRVIKRVVRRSLEKKSHRSVKRSSDQVRPFVGDDWKRGDQYQPVARSRVMRDI